MTMTTKTALENFESLLAEMRKETSAEKRERQFHFAHGYLRALVDADLLAGAILPELRELLITAAGRG